jgi:hypothetical protein
MSAKPRISDAKRLNWLLDNQSVWEGYPRENDLPGTKSHAKKLFEAMQKAGLFSKRTQPDGVSLMRLVDKARFIRRMSKQQPHPENN